MMNILTPEAGWIFRITHVQNVPWILDHGLHCQNSDCLDPNFVPIGLTGLIEKRTTRRVHIGPSGTLSDYVPFYFTPWSIMMYKIKTGHEDVIQRPNAEIVILVSSVRKLNELKLPFIFTNGHAYVEESDQFES